MACQSSNRKCMPSSLFSGVSDCEKDHCMLRELASVNRSPPKKTGDTPRGPFGTYLRRIDKKGGHEGSIFSCLFLTVDTNYCYLLGLKLEQHISQFRCQIFIFEQKAQGILQENTKVHVCDIDFRHLANTLHQERLKMAR